MLGSAVPVHVDIILTVWDTDLIVVIFWASMRHSGDIAQLKKVRTSLWPDVGTDVPTSCVIMNHVVISTQQTNHQGSYKPTVTQSNRMDWYTWLIQWPGNLEICLCLFAHWLFGFEWYMGEPLLFMVFIWTKATIWGVCVCIGPTPTLKVWMRNWQYWMKNKIIHFRLSKPFVSGFKNVWWLFSHEE